MPKISIIVPFLNAESTIENCIRNIENQKYKDAEIILINDGSEDKSEEIIKNLIINQLDKEIDEKNNISLESRVDPKNNIPIKYYYIKKDKIGVGKARNYGIEKANRRIYNVCRCR